MKIDLLTGSMLQSISLPAPYFGEGITIVNNHIYQLTWTSGQCFQYSMDMTLKKTHAYHTQGWGLTHQDSTLIVSDGSNRLFFYTPSFQKTGELMVYDNQGPVMNLNELEYIDGYVLANVWQTNRIVQIDLKSGKVIGELMIDPSLQPGVDSKENVLNGIAHRASESALYITGKNWPTLYKIKVKGLFKPEGKPVIALR
jgi:glutamine cyclotransferase